MLKIEAEDISDVGHWLYPTGICAVYLATVIYFRISNEVARAQPHGYLSMDFLAVIYTIVIHQDLYNGIILSAHVILGIMFQISSLMWMYYLLKILQLGEVFAHFGDIGNWLVIFHRISMVFMARYAAKYTPGGTVAIWEILDCLVHVIVLVLRPSYWEGRFVAIAIVDFIVIFFHLMIFVNCIIILQRDCGFPRRVAQGVLVYISILLGLKVAEPLYVDEKNLDWQIEYFFWITPITPVLLNFATFILLPLCALVTICYQCYLHFFANET